MGKTLEMSNGGEAGEKWMDSRDIQEIKLTKLEDSLGLDMERGEIEAHACLFLFAQLKGGQGHTQGRRRWTMMRGLFLELFCLNFPSRTGGGNISRQWAILV